MPAPRPRRSARPRPPRDVRNREAVTRGLLAACAAGSLLIVPAGASAATPFTIAGAGDEPSVFREAGGAVYVAYLRPASSGVGDSVGVCRIPAGANGCDVNPELPFPGAAPTGARAIGGTAITRQPSGHLRIWASCYDCGSDFSGAPTFGISWTGNTLANSAFTAGFKVSKGFAVSEGNATGVETTTGSALVAATNGGGVQARQNPPTPTTAVDLSPYFTNYEPSVTTAPDGRLIYATTDLESIVSSFFTPTGTPTVAALNTVANWIPPLAPIDPDPTTGSSTSLSLASAPSGAYLGYSYFVPLDERLRVRRYRSDVNRFGPPIDIQGNDPIDDAVSESAIGGDSTGRLHAVWESIHPDAIRLRYARTDTNGNAAGVLGTLARGEQFLDPQIAAGPGNDGLVVWHGNGTTTALRAVRLDPQPDALPGDGGSGDGGGGGTGGGGGVVVPPPGKKAPKTPTSTTKSTKLSVPGGTVSFSSPKVCVARGGSYNVRMAFQAKKVKKAARKAGNVVVKVRRADFYVGSKRVKRDTKAPFAQRIKLSPKSRPGSTIKLRAVASLKVKSTSRPRTATLRATIKVCR